RGGKRFGKQRLDILVRNLLGDAADPLPLADRGIDGIAPANTLANFARARPRDEQCPPARRLAVGKGEHALLTERVAAVAGQDVEQVVRVAKPVAIYFEHVIIARLAVAEFERVVDQPLRGQTVALHEIDIDASDAR